MYWTRMVIRATAGSLLAICTLLRTAHANDLSGVWQGEYSCRGNQSSRLTLTIKPAAGSYSAVFAFDTFLGPSGSGSYEMIGVLRSQANEIEFRPTRWIKQPPGYGTVGITVALAPSGGVLHGRLGSSCSSVRLQRVGEQHVSAEPPNAAAQLAPAATPIAPGRGGLAPSRAVPPDNPRAQFASACDRERPALVERAKHFQVTMPSVREIQLGDSVEVLTTWEPVNGRLGPQRFISSYVDMPADAEILDANGQALRVPAYSKDDASPYARATFEGERRKRFSFGHVTYDHQVGKLRIRPTKAGPFKLFAQIEVAHFSGRTYSLPDCPAILLSETTPITINVRPPESFNQPRACHLATTDGRISSPDVRVALNRADEQSARFGETVQLNWTVSSPLSAACKTPLYLVLSMPERVRFSGDGYFALTPGVPGPFRISHERDKVRVFVPLHIGQIARTGTVGMRIYQAGEFTVDWALVEVPASTTIPTKRADFSGDQAIVARSQNGSLKLDVLPGRPSVVVQDRFTSDSPLRSEYSRDGAFELQVFSTFYRVLDARSGELMLQRDGREPNFSETARFVHALLENDTDIEVVDLYSRAPIFGGTRGRAERTSSVGGVAAAAWGRQDSFALLAAGGGGNAYLLNTIVDRTATAIDSGSYKAPVVSQVDLRIDLEAMTVINAPSPDNGWRDTTTHHSLLESQADDSQWQPTTSVGQTQRSSRRYQRDYALFPLTKPEFTRTSYRWDLGDYMRLSYPRYCGSCPRGWEEMNTEELRKSFKPTPPDFFQTESDRRNWVEGQIQEMVDFNPMMVRHSSARRPERVASHKAQLEPPRRERSLMRKELTRGDAAAANDNYRALARVEAMTGLTFSGLRPIAIEGGKIATHTMDGKGGTRMVTENRDHELERALKSHAESPTYRKALRRFGPDNAAEFYRTGRLDVIWDSFSCAAGGGNETIGQFIVPIRIKGRRSWRSDSTTIWLVQQECISGSSIGTSSGQLGVLVAQPAKVVQYIPLRLDLGIDSMTVGERQAVIKSWLTEDDVLLIAGPNRALFVYDVKARKQIAYMTNAPEADVASALHLSADRSTLLQINENGRLFIYRLRDQKRLISGYYLDDEIVLHQDDGYYLATPEGAHFINLAFPGVEGHFSFQQFDKTLNRPDIVRAALAGKSGAPDPKLGVPPTLQIEADITGAQGARSVRFRYRAASLSNLQKLLVYVDGRPVAERELSGRIADAELSVPLEPEARWISALAVDDRGHESAPQTHALSEPQAARGKLFAVVVGTDVYEDPAIPRLGAARRDAEAFANAVGSLKGAAYKDVLLTTLLDNRDLRLSLTERLSEVVAAAGPNDTIMLFAAGHGTQGNDGRFYLVTPTTRASSLETTALGWEAIGNALETAKARVVVFLDACRSGSASGTGSNDSAAASLLRRSAAITVIAAAKGRQDSLETDSGGYFTGSLVKAVTANRSVSDSNSNGAIELAELYGVIKREVIAGTNGKQTPWIARNHMVGEIPLF